MVFNRYLWGSILLCISLMTQAGTLYRINAGGGEYHDPQGNTWQADEYFNTGRTFQSTASITGTDKPALFQTHRWKSNSPLKLTYNLPVPVGNYLVRLFFAETFPEARKEEGRIFDIEIEGKILIQDLDIFSESGFEMALTKEVHTQVLDGALTIRFLNNVKNVRIAAIEVSTSSLQTISNTNHNSLVNKDKGHTIVILGSSTAFGQGVKEKNNAWVNRYQQYLTSINPDNKIINLAKKGITTYHILPSHSKLSTHGISPLASHNITHALSYQPDAIIINLPSNDTIKNIEICAQLNNYKRLLTAAGKTPVWITTTQPRNHLPAKFRHQQKALKEAITSSYMDNTIDFWTGIARASGNIKPMYDSGDGVHFNDAAHEIFFQRVINKVVLD